ncbi:hypothetical protein IEE92_09325 [Kocuria sp. cx-116]|uniref:hypothetical protein n=1 Tax=Kocuria sp. cx-116 TaxID=2771378 RepID=UPI001687F08B|nr:hypothetical protein [Kocuria sp. cx-116]MBD2762748.1 hypothetical protein [Kocuria sp. cx-116]
MSLSVNPCENRKMWDARVRVTGGNPQLLWGIGEAESLTDEQISVERVMVDRADQTIGYGQLLIYPEDKHTVVDARSLHVKSPHELVGVLGALQDYARETHHGAVLRVSPDTAVSPQLLSDLDEAGYRRRDKIRKGEAGPRELIVRLGETESDLSRRLSSGTLERCRAGLKMAGVKVRRVSATTQSLANVGLRTAHIDDLLKAVGQDSVFLVVTEHAEGEQETALGYLWFVHTGESAMLYRVGFTDRARQLGVDDALLLTGLVQLQQRRVHKIVAGDPDSESPSVVLRELAEDRREILGVWEHPLISDYQLAGRAEKTRHKIFGERSPQKKRRSKVLAPQPARDSDPAAPETGSLAAQEANNPVDADPDLARQPAAPRQKTPPASAEPAGGETKTTAGPDEPPAQDKKSRRLPAVSVPRLPMPARPSFMTKDDADAASSGAAPAERGKVRGFARRIVSEGTAAIRDAARW